MSEQTQATKVVTGKVRFSYLKVWVAEAVDGGEDKKYSVSLIIPKSDTKTIAAIEKAIKAASEAGRTSKWGGKIPPRLKLPLRDGDDERPDDTAYGDSFFLNASCRTRPGVVDGNNQQILDQDELYSGCYGRASITFYAFDTNGNRGIACGLNNLQKLSDGEPLGGRSSAESDFGNVPFDEGDSLLD